MIVYVCYAVMWIYIIQQFYLEIPLLVIYNLIDSTRMKTDHLHCGLSKGWMPLLASLNGFCLAIAEIHTHLQISSHFIFF